jgi:hypothetical protein
MSAIEALNVVVDGLMLGMLIWLCLQHLGKR